MKSKIVKFSDIMKNKNHSLSPKDYIGDMKKTLYLCAVKFKEPIGNQIYEFKTVANRSSFITDIQNSEMFISYANTHMMVED